MRCIALLMVLAACGKGASGKEVEACDRMAKLCGEELSASDLKECKTEWPQFRKQFGDATADKFLQCTMEAKSCGEVLGCATGVLGNMGKDFEKGLEKMMKDDPTSDDKRGRDVDSKDTRTVTKSGNWDDDPFDEGPLPPECKRADEVCAKDEPFARDKCRRMVGNLKADAANLAELTACYAAAANCYAFKKCTDDMWFKLN